MDARCLSCSAGTRGDFQRVPDNNAGGRLWFGFYISWMRAGDIQSLWGCGISQPLWQIENHSASFCWCDSSGMLTGERRDKRVSLCEEIASRCCFPFAFFFSVERSWHIAVQPKELDYRSHRIPSGKTRIKWGWTVEKTYFLILLPLSSPNYLYSICCLSAAWVHFDPPPSSSPKCRCAFPVLWRECDVLWVHSEALKTTKGNETCLEMRRKLRRHTVWGHRRMGSGEQSDITPFMACVKDRGTFTGQLNLPVYFTVPAGMSPRLPSWLPWCPPWASFTAGCDSGHCSKQ